MSAPTTTDLETKKLLIETRMKEYEVVLDNTAKLSDRRQTTNDIFVGLNSLILTSLGFLLINSRLMTWWTAEIFGAVALFTTVVNGIWLNLNSRYKNLVAVRVGYLEKIERDIESELKITPQSFAISVDGRKITQMAGFGVHQLEGQNFDGLKIYGFSRLERDLVKVFIGMYFLMALGVAALTFAVMHGFIPTIDIRGVGGN